MDLERGRLDVVRRLAARRDGLVRLCRERDVRLLILFGSAASGSQRPDSDIDLAVDFGRDTSPRDELAFHGDLMEALDTDRVDLVNVRTAGPIVLREIALHGTPVYVRAERDFAEFQVHALTRFMDTARFRELRGRLVRARFGSR